MSRNTRGRGRPPRTEEHAFDAAELDRLLVRGEDVEENGRKQRRYPTYRELADRFGVSKTLIGRYASEHGCVARRHRAEWDEPELPEIQADPEQLKAGEELDAAFQCASSDEGFSADRILRMAERWLAHLEEAIDEGRVRPDLADLERFIRVIREAKEQGDERAGIPDGMPTLDELQDLYEENLRRDAAETPAMCGRLPIGTIPISWVRANEAQLRTMLPGLEPTGDREQRAGDGPSAC